METNDYSEFQNMIYTNVSDPEMYFKSCFE